MAIRVLGLDHPETDTFRVRVERLLPVALVTLEGQLTLATVGRLRNTLLNCLAECPDALVIDVARLSVDSNLPLSVFRVVRRHASSWPAAPVLLCSPGPALLARLCGSGMDHLLAVHSSRVEALAAARATPTVARADQVLPQTLDAPAQARNLVSDLCHAWGVPELIDDARLVVSELVTNAVIHAHGRVHLSLVLRHSHLHLVVRDESQRPPERQVTGDVPDSAALSGRGLYLLDLTAESWGHLVNGGGKAVWAVLRR